MAKSKAPKTPAKATTAEMAEIRDLIDFIAKSGLNEVDIETKELKVHVKRDPDQIIAPGAVSTSIPVQATPQPASTQPAAKTEKPQPEQPAAKGTTTVEIKSPMIGTFYRSANPDSPPFVSVGDKVAVGQTVCIIEAMKLFNEIESEVAGTIVSIKVDDATPVEYDQVLFVVQPD